MQNKGFLFKAILAVFIVMPCIASAQYASSINAFSPFTFYGLGDLHIQGPSYLRSMGGTGVGYRSATHVNTLNPASISTGYRNSFLFHIDTEGQNFYMRTEDQRSSFNTFNFRNFAIQFPLAEKIGMGFSISPLSSVGYRVDMFETDPDLLANVGSILYTYGGSGSITQAKVSFGAEVAKNLSLGTELVIYHGRINRSFENVIIPHSSNESFVSALGSYRTDVSKAWFNMGLQYNMILNAKRIFTFGATYQPKLNLNPNVWKIIETSGLADSVKVLEGRTDLWMPGKLTLGLFYQSSVFAAGLDFGMQNWGSIGNVSEFDNVRYRNTKSIKGGIQYTPNANDFRRSMNRWSYRLGFRYEDYYLVINDQNINDKAITAGVGIPVRLGSFSSLSVGAEVGKRGTTGTGFNGTQQFKMISETYVNFTIGFSLFGEDGWFRKYRYQ